MTKEKQGSERKRPPGAGTGRTKRKGPKMAVTISGPLLLLAVSKLLEHSHHFTNCTH